MALPSHPALALPSVLLGSLCCALCLRSPVPANASPSRGGAVDRLYLHTALSGTYRTTAALQGMTTLEEAQTRSWTSTRQLRLSRRTAAAWARRVSTLWARPGASAVRPSPAPAGPRSLAAASALCYLFLNCSVLALCILLQRRTLPLLTCCLFPHLSPQVRFPHPETASRAPRRHARRVAQQLALGTRQRLLGAPGSAQGRPLTGRGCVCYAASFCSPGAAPLASRTRPCPHRRFPYPSPDAARATLPPAPASAAQAQGEA